MALCEALDSGSPVVRDAGLMLVRDLAAAAQPSLFLPALPALLPRLLACAAEQDAREVAATADEALEQLLQRAPPQTCLGLLVTHLPTAAAALPVDRQAGGELHAVVRSLRRVVARMQPAGLAAHLHPLLLPGLCVAYGSPLADVRKATVDCLVAVWQVGGSVGGHGAAVWCGAEQCGEPVRGVPPHLLDWTLPAPMCRWWATPSAHTWSSCPPPSSSCCRFIMTRHGAAPLDPRPLSPALCAGLNLACAIINRASYTQSLALHLKWHGHET